jgi:YD repeat-containing protein
MLNVADGNLLVQADDVDVPERGIDLAFRRTYNSQSRHDASGTDGSLPSAFGNGWTNTFDAHLAYNGAVMSVYDVDGARYDYTSNGTGWTPPPGMQGVTLQWDGGCGYLWTKKTGTIYYFAEPVALSQCAATPVAAEFGRLQNIQGRNANNQITFTYSWSGNGSNPNQLTQIVAQHSDGDVMTLDFTLINGSPELASITRPDGLQVTYSYDGSGDLIGVERPGNNAVSELPETYSYNTGTYVMAGAAGPRYTINYNACGSSTCVTDGDSVAFSYSGAALSMVQDYGVVNFTPQDGISAGLANGGLLQPGVVSGVQTWHIEEFSGDSSSAIGGAGAVTNVTDNFGHARAWTYDGSGRVTQTQAWASPTSSTPLASSAAWDSVNDLTASVDVRGNQTNYTYDANGNTLSVQEPSMQTSLGAGSPESMYAYDANNNLIAYCDPNYVWTNHPATCPATGGTTYYTYTTTASEPFGELTATHSPTGYSYALAYDNYGEPTLLQGTAITQLDGTTRQPTQAFGYDGYGDLTSYNKGNGAWSVTYDNMHRPLTHEDPDGYVSYAYYNNDGSVSKTETPYQHANAWGSTATYDADGDAVAQTVIRQASATATPAPQTTSKYYDGADRLIEVKQPQDSTYDTYTNPWLTRYLYDLTGATNLNFGNAVDYAAYGNLYKTQELLPATNGPVTQTASTPQSIASTTIEDLKGTAFDGLDRPVAKYSLIDVNGASADSLSTETLGYDGTNEYGTFLGELTSDCNATSQCKYPGYDALERANAIGFSDSTPSRATQYDPDGHTTAVTSSAYGTQSYTYDADGHKLTEQEASGGNVTSPATFTHIYYGDGKLAQLNVASSGLNQTGLFAYSYRTDGLVQTQTINDAAQSNVGSTSVEFTYYPSGRSEGRTESGPGANSNPTTWQYDSFGRLSQVNYPACTSCNNEITSLGYTMYDPQGQILQDGYVSTGGVTDGGIYAYTARGEYAEGAGVPGIQPFFANGAQAPAVGNAYAQENYTSSASWDALSGVALSKSVSVPGYNSATQLNYTTVTASTFLYDQVGRLTAEANSTSGAVLGNGNDTLSRTYDAENHTITSSDGNTSTSGEACCLGSITAYNWGPTGHPIQLGSATGTTTTIPSLSSVQYDTLHWDGDQLVFQTNASGQVDDIKIGTSGDITPLDPSFTGLTFWDRGPGGAVAFCHNSGGTSIVASISPTASVGLLTCGGSYLQANGSTFTFPGPTSFIWSSAPFSAGPGAKGRRPSYQVGVGQGNLLGMYRADGMTDGLNTLQGVRTMDSNAGTWTTPDAYAGDVDDPGSQKSYMWNSNNAVSYSDPSGFSADPYSDYLAPPPDTGPPDPYGDSGAVRASSAGDSGETAEKLSYAPMSPSQLAQQGDQSAVPTGLQVEPSQTTFDAAATKEYGFHVDDWFYQLTNADGQPVTGKDYQAKESVVPAGDGTVTSNGQWPWIGGTKIRDQVGGSVSSILFQTFDIKYNGQVYSLPQELVHEVTVDPNGVTSTRVFEIVPDPMP